jgi:hypothetical protein
MKNGEKEIQSFVLKKAFWKIRKVSKAVFKNIDCGHQASRALH